MNNDKEKLSQQLKVDEDMEVMLLKQKKRYESMSLAALVAEMNRKTAETEDEKDKKTGKYIRKERYAGSMSRSFYIGGGITQDEISAKYENGILQLKIPKKTDKAVAGKNYIAIEG